MDASNNEIVNVTSSSLTNLVIALPALDAGTYWFTATSSDSKPYIARATVATATSTGNFYPTTVKMATLGDLVGSDGKFYVDGEDFYNAYPTDTDTDKKPVGVIAYLGIDAFSENGTLVPTEKFAGHGLVLALNDHTKQSAWGSESQNSKLLFEGQEVTDVTGLKRTTYVSGYWHTKTLNSLGNAGYYAVNYSTKVSGTTGWFLPSAQQWVKMIEALGGLANGAPKFQKYFDTDHTVVAAWNKAIAKAGVGNHYRYTSISTSNTNYWSSSEYDKNTAIYLRIWSSGLYWNCGSKTSTCYIRPVFAF